MVKLLGTTINETMKSFQGTNFGGEQPTQDDKLKSIGRIIVSVLLLFLATYLFKTNSKEVASSIVGALIGYWVK